MTITTASDTIPQSLLDLLSIDGLHLVDAGEVADLPVGPFTATVVRQAGDLAAVVLSLPAEDAAAGVLERAVLGGYPASQPDLAVAVGSLNELASQVPIPLDVNAVTANGRVVALLAVPVDRRSASPGGPTPPGQTSSSAVVGGGTRTAASMSTSGDASLGLLRNVSLEVTVELGRATLTFAQLLGLTTGSVVELDRAAGSPVDIRVNGMLFGRGEVVVVDDEYAVRVIEILNTELPG